MALKAVIDSLDSVPEALRGFYKPGSDGSKFVLDADGVEDVSGLRSALQKERDNAKLAEKAAKEARDALDASAKQFEGMDVSQVKMLLEKLGTDEEAKLIKEGKLDMVIEKRTEKLRKAHENQMKALEDKLGKELESEKGRAGKFSQRVLDNHIREAASKVGVHSSAVDDALFRGRATFSLDEEGNAVQLKDGQVVYGKDGRSAFSPQEWLESMRESAPHWFPATANGSGGHGQRPAGQPGQKTITRSQFDKLDAHQRAAHMKEKGAVVDDV